MVLHSIIALLVFIIFLIYLGWVFLMPVVEIVINGVILYAIYLRSDVEISREKKHYFYLGGCAAAFIIYIIAGNFLGSIHIWGATTYFILAYVCAQIGVVGHIYYKKYQKGRK